MSNPIPFESRVATAAFLRQIYSSKERTSFRSIHNILMQHWGTDNEELRLIVVDQYSNFRKAGLSSVISLQLGERAIRRQELIDAFFKGMVFHGDAIQSRRWKILMDAGMQPFVDYEIDCALVELSIIAINFGNLLKQRILPSLPPTA